MRSVSNGKEVAGKVGRITQNTPEGLSPPGYFVIVLIEKDAMYQQASPPGYHGACQENS